MLNMPRCKFINLSYGDIAPADMTLKLDYSADELNPAQLAAFEQAEQEHNEIKNKLKDLVVSSGAESVFLGEVFSAYQVSGSVTGLDSIAKPVAVVRKENKARQLAEDKRLRSDRDREASRRRDNAKLIEVIDDDEDEEYLPLVMQFSIDNFIVSKLLKCANFSMSFNHFAEQTNGR